MSRHFCIRLIQKLLRIFFFRGFKNRLILILLDSRNLTTYNQPTTLKRVNKYSISIRRPYIWSSFLSPEEKQITTMHKFKTITNSRLPFLENELAFF